MKKGYLNRDFLPDEIAMNIYRRKYRFYKNIILLLLIIIFLRVPTVIQSISGNKTEENNNSFIEDSGLRVEDIDKYLQLSKCSITANITEYDKYYEVIDGEQLMTINNRDDINIRQIEYLSEGRYKLIIGSNDDEE